VGEGGGEAGRGRETMEDRDSDEGTWRSRQGLKINVAMRFLFIFSFVFS
jgi:hypothetical protein